ncbi:hypothetical protein [Luteimonas sp. R10]|uniref:hypothetical protein n=1 Tax=Luteimonas sp. R10 TaxID=3108176 RepID=UPI0030937245|nr:hypothetical protein U3649_14455 [Luteimonas sp. R10]
MDSLDMAFVQRAHTALEAVTGSRMRSNPEAQAKAFVDMAHAMLVAQNTSAAIQNLKRHPSELVQKATAHGFGDSIWDSDDAAALAAAYLATIAEGSILDQVKKYARLLGTDRRRVMVASDAVGDVVAEGDPKPVRNLDLSITDVEMTKAAAIVVMTEELAIAAGGEGRRLFETELASAVNRAVNASVLTTLSTSNTIPVAGTGDPLADLRAGLRTAGPSNGYVVAALAGDVADLATRVENRGGMGVRGGTFVRGVEVVAMDTLDGMYIIPASRVAMLDSGLRVRSAGHASLDMRDTPESPAELVNLWQTNSVALLAERSWHLASAAELVIVGAD